MAVNFPDTPSVGQVHSEGGANWRWSGYAWRRIPDPGAKGEPGSKGDKGQKGEIGLTGSEGDKGIKGEPSTVAGDKGDKGQKGIDGTGADGSKGDKGIKGEPSNVKGQKGEVGNDGSDGDKGQKGEEGAAAAKGQKGEKGEVGDKGDKGQKGVTGSRTFTVTNSSASAYVIDGSNNPTLTLVRGFTYTFNVNATGHPFFIKTSAVTGTTNQYTNGVTNNGVEVGTLTFAVPYDAPNTLYYICRYHGSMQGTINIVDLGVKGDKGQKGEVGDKGQKGTDGTGIKGIKGDKGEEGDKGQKGDKGVGDKGQKGADNSTKGEKGAPGADNSTKGQKGQKGDQGSSIKGEPGQDNSTKGEKGAPGADNSTKGQKGEQGQKGQTGADNSTKGQKGQKGQTGADNSTKGQKGEVGNQGTPAISNESSSTYRNLVFIDSSSATTIKTNDNNRLQVRSSDGYLKVNGDVIAFASDDRLKTNKINIDNAVDKVKSINGFTYNFNENAKKLGYDLEERHAGVSAQEIMKILPEVVALRSDNEYLTVKYDKLVPLLIEAIKELKNEIDDLKRNG